MVRHKSLEETMSNWTGSHPRVANAYTKGVDRAEDPIGKGIAAEPLYQAKLTEAFAENKRAKNLAKVTNEEWKRLAKDKGARRIVDGMKAAEPKMRSGIGRVLSALDDVTLPPRTADGMENLMNRGGAVVKRMIALGKE